MSKRKIKTFNRNQIIHLKNVFSFFTGNKMQEGFKAKKIEIFNSEAEAKTKPITKKLCLKLDNINCLLFVLHLMRVPGCNLSVLAHYKSFTLTSYTNSAAIFLFFLL